MFKRPFQIDHSVHVYHHYPPIPEVAAGFQRLEDLIIQVQETLMPTLDETLEKVTANSSRIDSLQALLEGIKAQLAEALAGTTLPPAVQAKVDAIFTAASAQADDIDESLNANVPPPTP